MIKTFLYTLIACSLLALTGCKTRFVDFTIISTKNIDLSKAGTFQKGSTRSEGVDKTYIIIFIPTGAPNLKEAIDRAIESVPGAVALLDGVVDQGFFYFPYIYGEAAYTVEGTALIDPALVPGHAKGPAYIITSLDRSGKPASSRQVSQSEFEMIKRQIEAAAGTSKSTRKNS
jgi:hypothetical protein